MAINLKKGQTIDLRKNDKGEDVFDLSKMTIGLGWDVIQPKKGFLGKLFAAKEEDFDLDAIAFLLDENGHIANLGKNVQLQNGQMLGLQQSDVVFFNNMTFPSGTGPSAAVFHGMNKQQMMNKVHSLLSAGEIIVHTGDNLTGEGDGDDEQIILRLNAMPERVHSIIFLVCIYQGVKLNQHFGKIDNAFIRACDAKGTEIARFSLSNSPDLNGMCTMVFAEVYKKNGVWKFRALGDASPADNFIETLKKYLPQA